MAKKISNPNNLAIGSKVMLPIDERGYELRDGNDAVWEIIGFQLGDSIATLHLVGADAGRTAGAITSALRPVKQTYAEKLAEEAAAREAFMARELTTEELARLRDPEDLVAEYNPKRSYCIGADVEDTRYNLGWLETTIARNVRDLHYALKQAATNPNLRRIHAWPEAF